MINPNYLIYYFRTKYLFSLSLDYLIKDVLLIGFSFNFPTFKPTYLPQ